MGRVIIESYIAAPPARCFDLARNVDLHVSTAEATGESIVANLDGRVARGLLELSDEVTFRGRHFGITQQITARITKFSRPHLFRDSQVRGVFARFDHDHFFDAHGDGTMMRDVCEFSCPFGILGRVADPIVAGHLRHFVHDRNLILKSVAESDQFEVYLPESP